MAGRTSGNGLRRRRCRSGLQGGRSFRLGLGLGNGVGRLPGRLPGRNPGPGVEEARRNNGLGGVSDNGRRRHAPVKHPLSLGQDALRSVVGVTGVGLVAAVTCGTMLVPQSCSS